MEQQNITQDVIFKKIMQIIRFCGGLKIYDFICIYLLIILYIYK